MHAQITWGFQTSGPIYSPRTRHCETNLSTTRSRRTNNGITSGINYVMAVWYNTTYEQATRPHINFATYAMTDQDPQSKGSRVLSALDFALLASKPASSTPFSLQDTTPLTPGRKRKFEGCEVPQRTTPAKKQRASECMFWAIYLIWRNWCDFGDVAFEEVMASTSHIGSPPLTPKRSGALGNQPLDMERCFHIYVLV